MQNINFPVILTFHVLTGPQQPLVMLDYIPPIQDFSLPTQRLAIKQSTINMKT
jgi:hypothetical protein